MFDEEEEEKIQLIPDFKSITQKELKTPMMFGQRIL